MEEFKKDITIIKESLIKVEHDLKYHIKRTDLLENFMKNQIKFLMGVLIALFTIVLGLKF